MIKKVTAPCRNRQRMVQTKLELILSPAEFASLAQRDLSQAVCVVFDVLRATSSMITALANGAEAIIPVADIPEAIALRHKKVVLAHIENLAGEMGAVNPESLAHQLALLIDGAIVAAMVSRDPGVADTAGLAAGSLFGPSKVKKPKRVPAQLVAV